DKTAFLNRLVAGLIQGGIFYGTKRRGDIAERMPSRYGRDRRCAVAALFLRAAFQSHDFAGGKGRGLWPGRAVPCRRIDRLSGRAQAEIGEAAIWLRRRRCAAAWRNHFGGIGKKFVSIQYFVALRFYLHYIWYFGRLLFDHAAAAKETEEISRLITNCYIL
ncbi:MAG: hypothetical protein LUG15_06040, partial [Oscillospiraceae bacterium]|nr:hypothetical protein [Oscillospiraceae bacterium]